MCDYISKLPDDILSHIISLLSVRESVRARCLSHRWKDVVDCRSVVEFNAETVFGEDLCSFQKLKKEFVRAVDQFLNTSWEAQTISEFRLEFGLAHDFTSSIDPWIAAAIAKGVKTLDLNLLIFIGASQATPYALPCHRWHDSDSSCSPLRHLRLQFCSVSLCTGCKTWLGSLSTLELKCIALLDSDINHILSTALNLTSLTLKMCRVTLPLINVHLPQLKKLVIKDVDSDIDLKCPYLETLDYVSDCSINFSHLPFLRRAYLAISSRGRIGCSFQVVHNLNTNAPMLQHLNLLVISQVPLQLPSISMHSLKKLHLRLTVPLDFDLFTVTDMLNGCASLETLHLEVNYRQIIKRSPRGQYSDCPHRCLKEFKFERYTQVLQEMEFAQYLLKNAVALEQMIIVANHKSRWIAEPKFNLLHGIHPSAEIIILGDVWCHS